MIITNEYYCQLENTKEFLPETKLLCSNLLAAYSESPELGAMCDRLERALDDHCHRMYGLPWFRVFIYWRIHISAV